MVFYCNGYRSCYFHFQNADKLSSRFSNLNHTNIGISTNSKFYLKYYFTDKTCWTRNIRFTVIYKGLRTHLCYSNAIFVNCMYFLYIRRETYRRKKKRSKRQVKVLLWQFLKFSILCLPFCLFFLAFEIFLFIQSKRFPVGKNEHIQCSIFFTHCLGENTINKVRILITRSACWFPSSSSASSLFKQSFAETRPFLHHLRIVGTSQLSPPILHNPIAFPSSLLLGLLIH